MTNRRSFIAALGVLAAKPAPASAPVTASYFGPAELKAMADQRSATLVASLAKLRAQVASLRIVATMVDMEPAKLVTACDRRADSISLKPFRNSGCPWSDRSAVTDSLASGDAALNSSSNICHSSSRSEMSTAWFQTCLCSTESSMARRGTAMLDGAGRSGNGAARFLSPQNGIEPGLQPRLADSDQSVFEEAVAHVHAQNLEGSST